MGAGHELAVLAERMVVLQHQLEQVRVEFDADRRVIEHRAHREVDVARQAARELRAEMATAIKVREARLASLAKERDDAAKLVSQVQGELTADRARRLALAKSNSALFEASWTGVKRPRGP